MSEPTISPFDDIGDLAVKYDGDYHTFYDDDEELSPTPVWGLMLILIAAGFSITAGAFYLSFLCEKKKRNAKAAAAIDGEDDSTDEEQMERGLAIKKWKEVHKSLDNGESTHTETTRASLQPDESFCSEESDGTTSSTNSVCSPALKNMSQLISEPRCVLCSKKYEAGEDVAHADSPKCHHEFHHACLTKYWNKTKENNHKCPVCKVNFMTSASA